MPATMALTRGQARITSGARKVVRSVMYRTPGGVLYGGSNLSVFVNSFGSVRRRAAEATQTRDAPSQTVIAIRPKTQARARGARRGGRGPPFDIAGVTGAGAASGGAELLDPLRSTGPQANTVGPGGTSWVNCEAPATGSQALALVGTRTKGFPQASHVAVLPQNSALTRHWRPHSGLGQRACMYVSVGICYAPCVAVDESPHGPLCEIRLARCDMARPHRSVPRPPTGVPELLGGVPSGSGEQSHYTSSTAAWKGRSGTGGGGTQAVATAGHPARGSRKEEGRGVGGRGFRPA